MIPKLVRMASLGTGTVMCFMAGVYRRSPLLDTALLLTVGTTLMGFGIYWKRIFEGKKGK